jgi:hypothetical protein
VTVDEEGLTPVAKQLHDLMQHIAELEAIVHDLSAEEAKLLDHIEQLGVQITKQQVVINMLKQQLPPPGHQGWPW